MSSARQTAYDILQQTQQGRYPLDHWLDRAEPRLRTLSRADRALVHTLVYGTLRWQARLDFIIDQFAEKPGKIDMRARIILRLALFQIHHLDRVPAVAAVHSAVELAKNNRLKWAAGFINGLLRRAAQHPTVSWPDGTTEPDRALATTLSFPRWLTVRWLSRWGEDETRQLCEAINTIPPITLRANTLKTDREALMAAIQEEAAQVCPAVYAPDGITLLALRRPIPQWPTFQQGWFQVQDEAAQLVVQMLAPRPGERVWDACAGLGTKTAHIAQLMNNQGLLLASDLKATKLHRLTQDMQRLGITIATCRELDLTSNDHLDLPLFDRILVDAPCSGLGVLQKNPDGKWRLDGKELVTFQDRQIDLLTRAALHLRPGGVMVYAVCSFEPEENEAVVKAFLQKHPDFAIHHPGTRAAAGPHPALLTPEGWLSTLPHRHRMDGFFAAAFILRN
jgi:16S rRNA (cytosine967-C5)-methyltransferase